MDLRRQIRRFFYKYPRPTGALLLVVGVLCALELYNVYQNGGYYSTRTVSLAAIGVIYGPACLIEPRFLTVWDDEANPPHPPLFKFLSVGIGIIGAVLAILMMEAMRGPVGR